MNIQEKKALAIEKVASLQIECHIDEILKCFDRLSISENKTYSLVEKLDLISQRYDETLKKLAQ